MSNPEQNCNLCPRLEGFRAENRDKFPDKFNAPVPSFGSMGAQLLIVGLAPGLKGANFTGRPFTGDYAGDLLYATLLKFGFAQGCYEARADDGLELKNCRITNAVRCVPPQNKPVTEEINTCRSFLEAEIEAMPNLKIILSLGLISHNAVIKTFGQKLSAHKFVHNATHSLQKATPSPLRGEGRGEGEDGCEGNQNQSSKHPHPSPLPQGRGDIVLIDSYHCSRYNTNTKRLTTEMFEDVFEKIRNYVAT